MWVKWLTDWLVVCHRLQDMETQYRKEKEEADLLLEQHRLVGSCQFGFMSVYPVAKWESPVLNLCLCVFSTQTVTAETTRTNAPVRRAGGWSPRWERNYLLTRYMHHSVCHTVLSQAQSFSLASNCGEGRQHSACEAEFEFVRVST